MGSEMCIRDRVIPCYLVIMQPDLGTSILIAGSGIVVIWIAGLNIKYFVYSSLLLLVSFPFIVSISLIVICSEILII